MVARLVVVDRSRCCYPLLRLLASLYIEYNMVHHILHTRLRQLALRDSYNNLFLTSNRQFNSFNPSVSEFVSAYAYACVRCLKRIINVP